MTFLSRPYRTIVDYTLRYMRYKQVCETTNVNKLHHESFDEQDRLKDL